MIGFLTAVFRYQPNTIHNEKSGHRLEPDSDNKRACSNGRLVQDCLDFCFDFQAFERSNI